MDSGTSGGSMQSGSSGEDDQNDTSSFSAGVASIPRHHQHLDDHHHLPQTHLHQTTFSSQQHLDHYQPLTSIISGYNIPSPRLSSTNSSFLETLPLSDLDRIWSMSMNNVNPHSHHMFYSSTSSLAPSSSSAMNPSQPDQTTHQDDLQPIPIEKIPSTTTQPSKENGSSSGRVVKKRTRASRKTPTTVLTTDTTNFRAMVQEFTGIPTPPFGPSSFFPAKKIDLFGTNNGLEHPSLGSLLFSLNKSTTNNNPNPSPSPFAPPITTTSQINPFERERNQSSYPNPYQQQSQKMMHPQGSNSTFPNLPQGSDRVKNPNMAFHHSSFIPHCPPFQSKFSNSVLNDADDQLGAFSNVERGENENTSRTGN